MTGLADHYGDSRSGFTCKDYAPLPGSKRCKHYIDGGTCALPGRFVCVEWEKRNRPPSASSPPVSATPSVHAAVVPSVAPAGDTRPQDADGPSSLPATLSEEAIASFKALGVAVCFDIPRCGEVWIVPEVTGRTDRRELRVEDAATLLTIHAVFPGSELVSLESRHSPPTTANPAKAKKPSPRRN